MTRTVRALATAGALGASLLLAGCTKPPPKITVQTGSYSTTITPSTYCFDQTHCRDSGKIDFPVVNVNPQGTVLIDVPRQVVGNGWSVRALSLDGKKSYGDSGAISDRHTYRLISGIAGGDAFVVQVNQGKRARSDGSTWSFLVKIAP